MMRELGRNAGAPEVRHLGVRIGEAFGRAVASLVTRQLAKQLDVDQAVRLADEAAPLHIRLRHRGQQPQIQFVRQLAYQVFGRLPVFVPGQSEKRQLVHGDDAADVFAQRERHAGMPAQDARIDRAAFRVAGLADAAAVRVDDGGRRLGYIVQQRRVEQDEAFVFVGAAILRSAYQRLHHHLRVDPHIAFGVIVRILRRLFEQPQRRQRMQEPGPVRPLARSGDLFGHLFIGDHVRSFHVVLRRGAYRSTPSASRFGT